MEFTVNEILDMQKDLQNKYKDKWESICPKTGKNKLLWMIGEIGEVIDIIKKNGEETALSDDKIRSQLVEEMTENDFIVVELSSFQLMKMKAKTDVSVITNII